jgi:hypothetical protein
MRGRSIVSFGRRSQRVHEINVARPLSDRDVIHSVVVSHRFLLTSCTIYRDRCVVAHVFGTPCDGETRACTKTIHVFTSKALAQFIFSASSSSLHQSALEPALSTDCHWQLATNLPEHHEIIVARGNSTNYRLRLALPHRVVQ